MIVVILLVLFVIFVFGAGDALFSLLCLLFKVGWSIIEFVFKCGCFIIELFDGGCCSSGPTTSWPANNPVAPKSKSLPRKPDVEEVAKGSLIIIDGSNVIGACEKLGAGGGGGDRKRIMQCWLQM